MTKPSEKSEQNIDPCEFTLDPIAKALKAVLMMPKDNIGSLEIEKALKECEFDEFLEWYAGQKSPTDARILKDKVTEPLIALRKWENEMRQMGWTAYKNLVGPCDSTFDDPKRQEMKGRYDDIYDNLVKAGRGLGIFSKSIKSKRGAITEVKAPMNLPKLTEQWPSLLRKASVARRVMSELCNANDPMSALRLAGGKGASGGARNNVMVALDKLECVGLAMRVGKDWKRGPASFSK